MATWHASPRHPAGGRGQGGAIVAFLRPPGSPSHPPRCHHLLYKVVASATAATASTLHPAHTATHAAPTPAPAHLGGSGHGAGPVTPHCAQAPACSPGGVGEGTAGTGATLSPRDMQGLPRELCPECAPAWGPPEPCTHPSPLCSSLRGPRALSSSSSSPTQPLFESYLSAVVPSLSTSLWLGWSPGCHHCPCPHQCCSLAPSPPPASNWHQTWLWRG